MRDLRKHRAVVTGASAGIGAAMARQLAEWGCDLVVTARRADRLEALAEELRGAHGIAVTCVPLDLTDAGAPAQLVEAAYEGGEVDILINNAGFGEYQSFQDVPWERHARVLELNVRAVAELTHRFSARMLARSDRRGHIGNVASALAYFSVPYFAVYAASRTFVRNFSQAVAVDLKGTNVSVTCVCFGGTESEFNDVAGIEVGALYKPFLMSAPRAARKALTGILRRRRTVVTGGLNKLVTFFAWLLPRRFMSWNLTVLLGKPKPPALSDR